MYALDKFLSLSPCRTHTFVVIVAILRFLSIFTLFFSLCARHTQPSQLQSNNNNINYETCYGWKSGRVTIFSLVINHWNDACHRLRYNSIITFSFVYAYAYTQHFIIWSDNNNNNNNKAHEWWWSNSNLMRHNAKFSPPHHKYDHHLLWLLLISSFNHIF